MASGPIDAAAIGTVTYVDGDSLWGFGHPLDSVGARSLFLQDAYVYAVVANPVGTPDLTTYKLAAPGHDVGTLTGDGIAAVTGRLGVLPPRYPLTIEASDLDTGERQSMALELADERDVGLPTGTSALSVVGTAAVAQAAYAILHGSPLRESGDMCVAISAVELRAPMRFCNSYVGAGTGSGAGGTASLAGSAPVADFGQAASLIDGFELGPLHLTGVDVGLRLRRGLAQAFMTGASAPRAARRGAQLSVRLELLRVGGARLTRTIRVRVPSGLPAGAQDLVLTGTPSDQSGSVLSSLASVLGGEQAADEGGPRSVAALARAVAAIHRFDGVSAAWRPPGAPAGGRGGQRPVYRDPQLRISGTLRVPVRVS
jgi:hypothetical protein